MAFPQAKKPPAQGGTPFLPPIPQPLTMEDFAGMNTNTSRVGVEDTQCWWIDGFMPIGKKNLRTLPGVGSEIYGVGGPATIQFFNFANIGVNPICVAVLSDGSIYQINTATIVSVQMAPPGTIQSPSRQNVGMTQWGSQYVIIVAKQTDGYFIWDGTTFYVPGSSFAGGTVPNAIGGSAVETYQGRVWVASNATVFFSVPGSLIDFTSGNGGGNFTSGDPFLRVQYTELKQTNGFLYLIGDSSINYISGVQTSGSPPITTFTNQNADPEVGTPYPATVTVLSRNIVFANAWGCHVSYGAAVTKISEPLDGFYTSVPNFGGQQLSSAKAIVFGKRLWMVLVPIIDLFTGQQRSKLLIWDGQRWWASEQNMTITYIQHQEINSVLTAYATDGFQIRPLFQTASAAFKKRVMSKLWTTPVGYQDTKTADRFWGLAQYYTIQSPNVTLYVESEVGSESTDYTLVPDTLNSVMVWTTPPTVMTWTTASGDPMVWLATGAGIVRFGPQAIGQKGFVLGYSLETDCPDMAFISTMVSPSAWSYDG